MKILPFTLFVVLILNMLNQSVIAQSGFRGSYVVAAIGRDGVIMASDSRLVFFDKNDSAKAQNLAYYDSCPKIFVLGKYAIGFVGTATVGNVFLGEMVKIYEKKMPANIKIDSLLQSFISFYLDFLPPAGIDQFAHIKIFAIGYKDDKPLICAAKNKDGQWLINTNVGTAISSDIGSFVNNSSETMTCEQLAELADSSIQNYIDQTKNTSVGGLISVIRITPESETVWIKNKPQSFPWQTSTSLLKDYFDNNVVINFFNSSDKEKMEKIWLEELKSY